jgi:acetyltransferase-like isoleucine patch superfamily enzyme
MSALRRFLSDTHRTRMLVRNTRLHTTPPGPEHFARFGNQSRIVAPARVTLPASIHIGDRVEIREHAWLTVVASIPGVVPRLVIGDDTFIDRFAHIACVGNVDIGAEVRIGEKVCIADTFHDYEDVHVPIRDQPMAPPRRVSIGRGAVLGAGSVVLLGVTIGEYAQVAAGAVVTTDVPAGAHVAGNPACLVSA